MEPSVLHHSRVSFTDNRETPHPDVPSQLAILSLAFVLWCASKRAAGSSCVAAL